ncbi:mRNA-binding translational repressor SSD1 [Sporobolomyces salmoneus]|uniref:mRNA-binding translational repressor SSD1 n=1 Tax=Sporobolomyces salmoneus TaxID=183962 RepID=UPI0031799C99
MSSPPESNKKQDSSSSASSNPRNRSSGANRAPRSNSRGGGSVGNSNAKKTTEETATNSNPNSGGGRSSHGRKPSRGGGGGGGSGAGAGQRRGSQETTSRKEGTTSENLSNINKLLNEMKDSTSNSSSPNNPASQSPPPSATDSSSRSRGPSANAAGHRKNTSGHSIQLPPAINAPPPSSNSNQNPHMGAANLNPNAGGFLPGTLGPIHDMMDEGLITPTASRFDLMTGLPNSPPLQGNGFAHQNTSLFEDPSPFRGGGGGFNPTSSPTFSNNQQYLQLQAQQQQQFDLQRQIAQLGGAMNNTNGGAGVGGFVGQMGSNVNPANANDLIAEQMAIQQQLANLKLQQESLMARFGDMQANLAQVTNAQPDSLNNSPRIGSSQAQASQGQHRRIPSNQQSQPTGAMGQFGQGVGGVGFGGVGGAGTKSHARRVSVNTTTSANSSPNLSQSPPIGSNPRGGFAGSSGGFTFGGAASNAAGGGGGNRLQQRSEDGEFGGWGESSLNQSQGRSMGHHRKQSGSVSSLGGWTWTPNQSNPANLAEAQSHLQQLATYRASAGHARVPSFGMSQIGPGGQGGPGQLAMAGYGGGIPQPGMHQGNNNNNHQMRKSLFAPYLPQASIPPLLAAGKLVIGTLRVNKRNRSDAYVATDVLDSDIYICGSKDRNRALEGDIVAVELLDVDDVWGTKKDKEEKKRKKEEQASFDPRASRDLRKLDKKKDDVEVEGQGLTLLEEEEVNDEQKPQFAGHVVAVLERAPGQLFSGMLGVLRPSSAATQQKQDAERREREGVDLRGSTNGHSGPPPKIIWFRPTDKRVPLIAIPTEQAPADFVEKSEKYSDRLFVACIKRWPISSLHPFGQLVEELGPIGDIETETSALLKDCNFTAEDFSESVNKCLPPTPWSIPDRETQADVRRDLRNHRVFTIDPETAKDLDDALHIVKNEDGTYEVGVHIADVSHFVKTNTPLDREARKRATTVYLVQRAVPMLPPTLSEELCSLNPGSDKLTFSVIFQMTPEGKVLDTWFGKTIINSKVKLAYSNAQEVIEGRPLPDGKVDDFELQNEIENDIKALGDIAKLLRARRFDNGALRIDNVKVSFALNEFGLPEDCAAFERKEANELIEEYMLLANISVAGKIASGLPDQALLRRHEAPVDRRLDAFISRMKRLGLDLDGSSAGALMKSFASITDKNERLTLQHLSTRSMQRAKYFCTGSLDISKYAHYALSVPLYTHFTSPIRRYADIMVHRQLEAILLHEQQLASSSPGGLVGADPKFSLDTETVAKIAQVCNTKKEAARLAQEQSQHLFLCVLISDLTKRYGPVICTATVIGVLDQAYDVLVPEFGQLEKRLRIADLPTESFMYDEHTNSLTIYWKKGVDVLSYLVENNQDDHLARLHSQVQHHAKMMESETTQTDAEKGLFEDDDNEEEQGERDDSADAFAKAARKSVETQQHIKSRERAPLKFDGLSTKDGHACQVISELHEVPVIISADMTKSPPVLKVVAVNPFAQ